MDQLLSLPTDILLHLLNSQFSLQELLHLRVLCHHFRCLIESANCIGRRRTLKLFWSFRDIKRYTLDLYQLGLDTVPELRLRDISSRHSDDLVLISAKFTESTCDLLVRLFHRVRHLVIYFTHNKRDLYTSKFSRNYADYLLLARHLFPKLTHLTGLSLFGKFNHSTCHADLHQHHTEARVVFCEAINRIGSLRRLDLCLENLFDIVHPLILNGRLYYVRKLVPASLEQILPHLERLSFCGRSEQFVERIIGHLGAHCSTLRLHRLYLPPTDQGQQMIKQLAQRSITLKHLQMTQQFYSISSRAQCFAQLESLELMLHHENDPHEPKETMCRLEVILPNLVKLNKLAKLTLMGFDITLFEQQQQHQLENSLPIMRQIGQLSINSAHYLLSNTRAWFRGLSHIFPTVHHLTLAFNMYYTIDLRTDVSRNFPNCTHFRLLYLLCDDLTHTLVSSLGRHHRKRFYRLYDRQPGMSVDLWCEEDQHEAEQLWTRTNGQSEWVQIDF